LTLIYQPMSADRPKPPGRWKKGESGNIKGRPRGTGAVALLRAAIAEHVPAIIERLVELAKSGDVGASRLLLERVCAPLRPAEHAEPVALAGDTLSAQGRAVLTAVAEGRLAPGQGQALLSALGDLARLIESDELERRICEIEAALAHREGEPP
jgi:hypothetical protein